MKIQIHLDKKDIDAAIRDYARNKLGMVTSGEVTISFEKDDRQGPTLVTASVMAEPVRQDWEPGEK